MVEVFPVEIAILAEIGQLAEKASEEFEFDLLVALAAVDFEALIVFDKIIL
jgi:hypothetical protein